MAPENPLCDITTPEWAKHAVFYQIFPDRFAQSPAVAKPAHLEPWDAPPPSTASRAATCWASPNTWTTCRIWASTRIYLNPIFQSTANHRYHHHDYYHVDPILGGNEAFRALPGRRRTAAACASSWTACSTTPAGGSSSSTTSWRTAPPRPTWTGSPSRAFRCNAYERQAPANYARWWNLPALPKFNTDQPDGARVPAAAWPSTGSSRASTAGGWTCPTRSTTTPSGRSSASACKAVNPDAYIVGEIWHERRALAAGRPVRRRDELPVDQACLGFFVEGGPDSATGPAAPATSHVPAWTRRLRRRPSTACWRCTRRPSPSASSTCSTATTLPAS